MLSLRDYQRASLDALYEHWADGGGNGLIVLPTGAGKALVIAAMVRELLERYPSLRIAMVTHTKELIAQNAKELLGYWPGAPIGIYSAGLGRRDTRSRILFCGIQSVARRASQIGAVDLVIVDEAHLIPRSADTFYGRFLADLTATTPDLRIVGLTATPFRLDSGRLDQGQGALFERVVYDAQVGDLIRDGYLCKLINRATETTLDTTGVPKRGGDFVPGALEAAVDIEETTRAAVEEIVRHGRDRRAWLAFCAGVAHAHHVAEAVREAGHTCGVVTGDTPAGERDRIIADYRAGRIRCLTSVGVLTTGFNVPHVDMIALLRPTQSAGLYIQQVGRALRNAPGKDNALILDFARLIRTHGPIDAINVKDPSKGDGVAPIKTCPACQSMVPAGALTCEVCGHEFPPRETARHDAKPDEGVSILSGEPAPPPWLKVYDWSFRRHRKAGSPDSLCVEFSCGLGGSHRIWVCLEHEGYARARAERWWSDRGGGYAPATVDEGLTRFDELAVPAEIRVRQNGKYTEVVGYRDAAQFELAVA